MSLFQATNIAITGGTHVAAGPGSNVTINPGVHPGVSSAFQSLSAATAHTALHNSSARFDAPRCHRNTRTSYLDAFERWILGHGGEYSSVRLIWLTGGAGTGKSAIMQSIVERCAKDAVILGTFFFSRTDASRNYAEVLIPTLAYQLVRNFPAAIAVLEPIILHDPLIFKASLETQAHELLVRPLRYLIETGAIDITSPLFRMFVVDGLDECDDPKKQACIIHVVATILCSHDVPISFLIASRPEVAISRALQREKRLHSILASINLDDNVEASSDIRQFIEDSFLDIRDTHPLRAHIALNWPNSDSVDYLVWKSSGPFIYAATAMKFISSTDEHPGRALRVVEGLEPSRMGNPFAELDALYLHILTSAKHFTEVLGILRHCILTQLDNSVRAVCLMYPHIAPEDVILFLSDVQALVSVTPDSTAEMWISLKHASISDFLMDANRSLAIYMSEDEYSTLFLPHYFQLLDDGPQLGISSLFSRVGGDHKLMLELNKAIAHSQDTDLLLSLLYGHPPQNVWNFCLESLLHDPNSPTHLARGSALSSLSIYMFVIRNSAANYDNTLYIHLFKMFIHVLMDDLDNLVQSEPQYRIIPALILSLRPSWSTFLAPSLIRYLPQHYINWGFTSYFWSLRREWSSKGIVDPRTSEAIRNLPPSQFSRSSDLTVGLELLLRNFMNQSWTPEHICPNPHERWLQQVKPLKHVSQGSPKLASTIYSHLCRLPTPKPSPYDDGATAFDHYRYRRDRNNKLWDRREQSFVLLKMVVCYLHKCDSTSGLAKLARGSLPKAALWFPRLMKRARAKMDAYVLRWEGSPDALLEKAQLLSIDEMD